MQTVSERWEATRSSHESLSRRRVREVRERTRDDLEQHDLGDVVKERVAYFQSLFAKALAEAVAEAAAFGERDPTKAGDQRRRRRALMAERWRLDAEAKRAPRPTFENVAASPDELVLQPKAPTEGLVYAIVKEGEVATWNAYTEPLKLTESGTYAVCSKRRPPPRDVSSSSREEEEEEEESEDLLTALLASLESKTGEKEKKHKQHDDAAAAVIEAELYRRAEHESEVATAVYELGESPPYLQYEECAKQLAFVPSADRRRCVECGNRGGTPRTKLYARGDYAICRACALTTGKAGVMVDPGARRMWFSKMIAFVGNRAVPLPSSQPILTQILRVLQSNPGIAVRFEGHVNSNCGLDCDGSAPCRNSTDMCRQAPGGSLGLSTARANAVRAFVLACGIEDDRVYAIGFSGTRPLVDDLSQASGHLNRRVEVHVLLS